VISVYLILRGNFLYNKNSVPVPDPPDPHVFGPPDPLVRCVDPDQGYGSGSFYRQAKIVRKP
jgi:hypothetical protein